MFKRKSTSHRLIHSFEAKALRKRSLTVRVADWLTSYFGSISFLASNLGIFVIWILINNGVFPAIPVFDPYPHVLLITFVSLEAIVLSIIVLMSQNRQSHIGTLRDELQLQVELITEREISKILVLLKKLLEQGGQKINDADLEEMIKEVDTSYIERKLEGDLAKTVKTPVAKKVAERVGKSLKTNKPR